MLATHAEKRHGSAKEITLPAMRDFSDDGIGCMLLLKTSSLYCQHFTAEQLLPGQAGWSIGRCVWPH
jgi:hypothetical protein